MNCYKGHRDDAKYLNDGDNNPGNFQALLQFCCSAGDTVLAGHLETCARKVIALRRLKLT